MNRFAYLLTLPLLLCVAPVGCNQSGDDGDDGSDSGNTASGQGESGSESGEESGESGGTPLTCDQAATEADCDAAYNPGEDSECSWLPIHEVTLDGGGGCVVTATDRGVCAQRSGLDDGCNMPFLCDGNIEAYVQETGTDTWDLATGPACRGVPDFEACLDDADVPCSCACNLP